MSDPQQDPQTVTPTGQRLEKRIAGLEIVALKAQMDARGELTELYNLSWGLDPLVYSYMVVSYPQSIRAWVLHKQQTDRLVVIIGRLQWAFFDAREDSPTHQMLNHYIMSEHERTMLVIPPGVYHGVKNMGFEDAIFINQPNMPYNHANPDKYRLPLKNDLIPFDFS
jgi:dTDP-4-dehydrorhamnose 3,5-epimerase